MCAPETAGRNSKQSEYANIPVWVKCEQQERRDAKEKVQIQDTRRINVQPSLCAGQLQPFTVCSDIHDEKLSTLYYYDYDITCLFCLCGVVEISINLPP